MREALAWTAFVGCISGLGRRAVPAGTSALREGTPAGLSAAT